jgi:hypothetical protein
MGSSTAVMNTLRIIGGAIGPIISGVIMQIFLTEVIIDGKEQMFPSVVVFNLIFFICMILSCPTSTPNFDLHSDMNVLVSSIFLS